MKLFHTLIRIVAIVGIYALSLYVFKSSSFYSEIETNLEAYFNISIVLNMVVSLLALVAFFRKSRANLFIYLSAVFLCLPSVISYVKFNWINIFLYYYEYSTSLSEQHLTIIGFIILGCSIVLYYNTSYEKDTQNYIERGISVDEIKSVLLYQFGLLLFVLMVVGTIITLFTVIFTYLEQGILDLTLSISQNPVLIAGFGLVSLLILGLLIFFSIRPYKTSENNPEKS